MGTLLGPKWQFLDIAGDLKEAGRSQLDYQVWPCITSVLHQTSMHCVGGRLTTGITPIA